MLSSVVVLHARQILVFVESVFSHLDRSLLAMVAFGSETCFSCWLVRTGHGRGILSTVVRGLDNDVSRYLD